MAIPNAQSPSIGELATLALAQVVADEFLKRISAIADLPTSNEIFLPGTCDGQNADLDYRCCLGRNHPGLCYDEGAKRGFRRTNPKENDNGDHGRYYTVTVVADRRGLTDRGEEV